MLCSRRAGWAIVLVCGAASYVGTARAQDRHADATVGAAGAEAGDGIQFAPDGDDEKVSASDPSATAAGDASSASDKDGAPEAEAIPGEEADSNAEAASDQAAAPDAESTDSDKDAAPEGKVPPAAAASDAAAGATVPAADAAKAGATDAAAAASGVTDAPTAATSDAPAGAAAPAADVLSTKAQEVPPASSSDAAAPVPAAAADAEAVAQGQRNDDAPASRAEPAAVSGGEGLSLNGKTQSGVFGTYTVRIGVARPNFNDGLKFYDKLYGSPKLYPTLAASWYAWDWYATLGLRFETGYYSASGHAAKETKTSLADVTSGDLQIDSNGPTDLTLIPFQVALTAEITPFTRKWVVLQGWVGFESLYWQEVRTSAQSTGTQPAMMLDTVTGTDQTTGTTTDTSDTSLTNRGWSHASVIGASANILLNPLDEESSNSMRGSMGIGSIYLSPFMEIARTLDKSGVKFGRTSFGLGFTFESVK